MNQAINFIRVVVFAISFWIVPSAIAENQRLSIEAFTDHNVVRAVTLSPDGKNLVFIAGVTTEKGPGKVLSLVNVDTKERQNFGFTDNSKFKYTGLTWINNKTILIVVEYQVLVGKTLSFETMMYKLDIETGEMDDLVPPTLFSRSGKWKPAYYGYVVDYLEADPDHFLFATSVSRERGTSVHLISLKGDPPVLVQPAVNYYYSWIADKQARVRLARASRGQDKIRIMVRGIEDEKYRALWTFAAKSDEEVIPIGFDFDPNILYIKAQLEGRWVIYSVDLRDENLTRTLVYDNPEGEPLGNIRYSKATRKVVGVSKGGGRGYIFWDPKYQGLYKTINRALPNLNNRFYGLTDDGNRLLVFSSSDIESGAYYVWDRSAKSVDLLAFRREALSPEALTKQVHTNFSNRVGIELPLIYTFPGNQAEPKPTVIVLSKEPGLLYTRGFYNRAQFLANRGYNVVHLNLREPDSKDKEYLESGIIGWGPDSINDLEDLTKHLRESPAVDMDNICVFGERYGGTVALTAPARIDFPFKCAISVGGITEFRDFLDFKGQYTSYWRHRRHIGEKVGYSVKHSPTKLVDGIKLPVLLVHGEEDKMVAVDQSREFHKLLRDKSVPVTYTEIAGAGHNMDKGNELGDFYLVLEEFLEDNFHAD